MKPELIADYRCQIGENPLWHPLERCLYWTDITGGKLFRYDPAAGKHEQCYQGTLVGGFTIQSDGTLLIPPGSQPGRLYRLDTDGKLDFVLEDIGISNGLGFTVDRLGFYCTDSLARTIYLFDYEAETGSLSNQPVWLRTPDGAGESDGLTVDADGYVLSARWADSALYRYTPEGVEERRIEFPAKKVSSVAFGGDDLTDLYVTTALLDKDKSTEGQGAGALFRLRPGIHGLPEYFSNAMII